MPTSTPAMRCPECDGKMVHRVGLDTVTYKAHSQSIELPGFWCKHCGEAVLEGEALARKEMAYFELRARVEQVLGPREVATIREQLKLSQRRAGQLLGGGPRAFQKYESGEQAVSVPMTNLLRLLAKDPRRLRELEEAHLPAVHDRS
jgi:HTH-type transcriptional regulator / antitoxin MqsA